jgi:hypothetical protein
MHARCVVTLRKDLQGKLPPMHFLFPIAVLAAAFLLLGFVWTLGGAWA